MARGQIDDDMIPVSYFLALLLSIPVLVMGIVLNHHASTDCENFLEKLEFALGVLIMVVCLAGVIVGCSTRDSWLSGAILVAVMISYVLLLLLTTFAFEIHDMGNGEALPGKGYREYRLGGYSGLMGKRFNSTKHWSKIKSCLQKGNACQRLADDGNKNATAFYSQHLSPIQVKIFHFLQSAGF